MPNLTFICWSRFNIQLNRWRGLTLWCSFTLKPSNKSFNFSLFQKISNLHGPFSWLSVHHGNVPYQGSTPLYKLFLYVQVLVYIQCLLFYVVSLWVDNLTCSLQTFLILLEKIFQAKNKIKLHINRLKQQSKQRQ